MDLGSLARWDDDIRRSGAHSPGRSPRRRAEAALRQRGLDVRETASP